MDEDQWVLLALSCNFFMCQMKGDEVYLLKFKIKSHLPQRELLGNFVKV